MSPLHARVYFQCLETIRPFATEVCTIKLFFGFPLENVIIEEKICYFTLFLVVLYIEVSVV